MAKLTDTFIRYAPLSKRIVVARFGKDRDVALETRDAMNEFLQVLIQYAFDDGKLPSVGDEAEVKFGAGDEQFVLTVKRIPSEAKLRRSQALDELGALDGELLK